MSLIKRNKTFHAVTYENGKQVWKSLKTDDPKQAAINYGKLLAETKIPLTERPWEDFVAKCLNWSKLNLSIATSKNDEYIFRMFNRNMSLNKAKDFTPKAIEDYKQIRIGQDKNPLSINIEIGKLKCFARRAMKWGYLPKTDFDEMSEKCKVPKKFKKYFDFQDIETIRNNCLDTFQYVLFQTAIYTGFRRAELAHLTWDDVDFKNEFISIRSKPDWQVKDYEERKIQLHPSLKTTLEEWQKQSHGKYIFLGRSPQALSKRFKRTLDRLRLDGSMHTTRHTFCTNGVQKFGIENTKEAVGHASVKTTELYSHQKSEVVPISKLDY